MEKTVQHELMEAKAKHYLFKSKMRAYINGPNKVSEQLLIDHTACSLGKWIKEVGKVNFVSLNEIKELDKVHQEMHNKAIEIVHLKKQGLNEQAIEKLNDIELIGIRIMNTIDDLSIKLS